MEYVFRQPYIMGARSSSSHCLNTRETEKAVTPQPMKMFQMVLNDWVLLISMYVCMHVCMYVYIHACMHGCIHVSIHRLCIVSAFQKFILTFYPAGCFSAMGHGIESVNSMDMSTLL